MKNRASVSVIFFLLVLSFGLFTPVFAGQQEDIRNYCDMLMSKNDMERAMAVDKLVKIGKPAVPSLIDALNKGQVYLMKQGAAKALGLIGDKRAVPSLVKALEDPNYFVKEQSLISLGNIGDTSAVPAIIDAMKKGNPYLKKTGAGVLGKLKDKQAKPYLQELVKNNDPVYSTAAGEALKQLK